MSGGKRRAEASELSAAETLNSAATSCGLNADCQAPVQNWTVCFVSAACCLRASAEATLRARPAAAFAALNHMLISGFFFNQGFAIYLFPSMGRSRLALDVAYVKSKTFQDYRSA
jgi:hypothetical protein